MKLLRKGRFFDPPGRRRSAYSPALGLFFILSSLRLTRLGPRLFLTTTSEGSRTLHG